jgi:hypothetical protein
MAQDLRDMFKKEQEKKYVLNKGHEARFMDKLNMAFPQEERKIFGWGKMAAAVAALIFSGALAIYWLNMPQELPTTIVDKGEVKETDNFSFGDLSPELKKVEEYYVANINLELAKLEVSASNKELVDGYMDRMAELTQEYQSLNKELVDYGISEQTITALIENLQLRLQLLQKLKKKLNELKTSKNEQITENSI